MAEEASWDDYDDYEEEYYQKGEEGSFITRGGAVFWVGKEKALFSSFLPEAEYIHIPAMINGVPVSLRNNFYCPKTAKEVIIEKGVLGVYHLDFIDCTQLTKISIHADLSHDHVVPNAGDRHQEALISNCPKLTSFYFMGEHHVSESFFYVFKCPMLQEFVMPEERDEYSNLYFMGGQNVQNLVLFENQGKQVADGITYSWDEENQSSCLVNYSQDKKGCHFTIPDHVTEIDTYAFESNLHLETLSISATVQNANFHNNHLQAINVSPDNKEYMSFDGVLYDSEQSTIIAFPSEKRVSSFTIFPEITHISHFSNNYLQALSLAEGIVQFPASYRFDFNCPALSTLQLPSTLRDISHLYDMENPSLEEIVISDSNSLFTTVDGVLFSKDQKTLLYFPPGKKGTYTVPEGTKFIHTEAFSHANKIETLVFPQTLLSVSPTVFLNFSSLKQINIMQENPYYCFENGALFNKSKSVLISYIDKQSKFFDVPVGTKTIGSSAFMNNPNLEVINLPYTVTEIQPSAFDGAKLLKTVSLPLTLQHLGERAFYHCLALEKIMIPKSLTSIEPLTFSYEFDWIDDEYSFITREDNYYPKLELWLPSSIKNISTDAFENRNAKHEIFFIVDKNSPAHLFAADSHYYYRFSSDPTIFAPEQYAVVLHDLSSIPSNTISVYPTISSTIPINFLPNGTAIRVSTLSQQGRVQGILGNETFYINRSKHRLTMYNKPLDKVFA